MKARCMDHPPAGMLEAQSEKLENWLGNARVLKNPHVEKSAAAGVNLAWEVSGARPRFKFSSAGHASPTLCMGLGCMLQHTI